MCDRTSLSSYKSIDRTTVEQRGGKKMEMESFEGRPFSYPFEIWWPLVGTNDNKLDMKLGVCNI